MRVYTKYLTVPKKLLIKEDFWLIKDSGRLNSIERLKITSKENLNRHGVQSRLLAD